MAGAMAAMSDPYYRGKGDYLSDRERGKFSHNADKLFREQSRDLKEFSINGRKVMAYSKKDAITRLKRQKKQ